MSKLGYLFHSWKSATYVKPARQVRTLSLITHRHYEALEMSKGVHDKIQRRSYSQFKFYPSQLWIIGNRRSALDDLVEQQQRRSASSSAATASGGNVGGEARIKSILAKAFPAASKLIVEDISGGCGSMYQVHIESSEFEGLSIVKQHQLVNKALEDEIKIMHGIRIETKVSKK